MNYQKFHIHEDELELVDFMKQSLEDQFKDEPTEGKLVIFRYSNGKKEQRIFPANSEV